MNETLPKAKEAYKLRKTEESANSDTESTITDIEMEMMSVTMRAKVPNHGDITDEAMIKESAFNIEITETDTEIERDTEALLENSKSTQNNHNNIAFTTRMKEAVSTFKFSSLGKKFIRHHKKQCIACCHCCLKSRSQSLLPHITSCETEKKLGQGVMSNLKKIVKLLLDRRVILSTLIYGIMGYVAVMTNEVSYVKSEKFQFFFSCFLY